MFVAEAIRHLEGMVEAPSMSGLVDNLELKQMIDKDRDATKVLLLAYRRLQQKLKCKMKEKKR